MTRNSYHFDPGDSHQNGNIWGPELPNYYNVLQLPADCSVESIRKKFKKFALQFHPDKNPHDLEGAERAFKKVNEAFSVLSDPFKRAEYDLLITREKSNSSKQFDENFYTESRPFHEETGFGIFDRDQSSQRQFYEAKNKTFKTFYSKVFDAKSQSYTSGSAYSNVFQKGGSKFTGSPQYDAKLNDNRNKYQYRKRQRFKSFDYGPVPKRDDMYCAEYFKNKMHRSDDAFSSLVYLLPLTFIIFILVLNASINNESLFSFTQDYNYSKLRTTHERKIPYYVAENFADKMEGGNIRDFERHVEIVYKDHLQSLCDSESEFRESNIIKAKYFKNWDLLSEMESLPMPNCLRLYEVFKSA